MCQSQEPSTPRAPSSGPRINSTWIQLAITGPSLLDLMRYLESRRVLTRLGIMLRTASRRIRVLRTWSHYRDRQPEEV